MNHENTRRSFLRSLGLLTLGVSAPGIILQSCNKKPSTEAALQDTTASANPGKGNSLFFKISLAEWSLNKSLFAGTLSNLDFPAKARNDFGISAVEYVNQFFKDKAKDQSYLNDLKKRCDDNGVTSVLIMIDNEGHLGEVDNKKRSEAVENHKKWVDAAKFLGCHSIRVNAYGKGSRDEVAKAATEGLRLLSEYAKDTNINVIVENHGSYSSDGKWLASVIQGTQMSNCGTLPDFGNFCIKRENDTCAEWYDRYQGIKEMMPFAKGVSAKSYDFDSQGNCIETDYNKTLSIVKEAGFNGHIGIEYEGSKLSEDDGIRATKKLLERVGALV